MVLQVLPGFNTLLFCSKWPPPLLWLKKPESLIEVLFGSFPLGFYIGDLRLGLI